MDVLLFGRLAELAGPRIEVRLPPGRCAVSRVRALVAEQYPALAGAMGSGRVRCCVGETIVPDSHDVDENDVVEFLPQVSGG